MYNIMFFSAVRVIDHFKVGNCKVKIQHLIVNTPHLDTKDEANRLSLSYIGICATCSGLFKLYTRLPYR